MTKKRVLVNGCGSIGRRHLRLLRERADVEVAACDVDPSASTGVRDIGSDIAFFTDYSEALRWKPEFVIVATPNRLHAEPTLRALAAGAHVLCEKPLADTVAQGRRMVAAARRYRRLLAVGYTERYRPSIEHLEAMIRNGDLGTLIGGRAMVGTYNTLICSRTSCRDDFGALLVDYTHEFDFLRAFFGEVKQVECLAGKLGKKKLLTPGIFPTVAATLLRYESGAIVSVHMDYIQHPQRRLVEVYGDRQTVELDLQTDVMRIFDSEKPGFQTLTFESVRDNRFRAEYEDWFTAARNGTAPRVDGQSALRVLEVAEAAIRRLRRRKSR